MLWWRHQVAVCIHHQVAVEWASPMRWPVHCPGRDVYVGTPINTNYDDNAAWVSVIRPKVRAHAVRTASRGSLASQESPRHIRDRRTGTRSPQMCTPPPTYHTSPDDVSQRLAGRSV